MIESLIVHIINFEAIVESQCDVDPKRMDCGAFYCVIEFLFKIFSNDRILGLDDKIRSPWARQNLTVLLFAEV